MERGDKYRFEGFPGLAEGLIEKVLEVSSLFYKVDWEILYTEDGEMAKGNTINGVDGTPDILKKIASLTKLDVDDNIQTAEFSDAMLQINEAALTMRNMVMLEENAQYVSEMLPLRDFLSIALNLPNVDSVVELKHYALDIAEQITKYLHLDETDPLYRSLLEQIRGVDRGAILTSLRAVSRISMTLEENNLLPGVPKDIVQNIIDWTLLNDEDLVHACLDFLYQYTAVVGNVDFIISEIPVEPLVNQLIRLLMHGARACENKVPLAREYKLPAPVVMTPLPRELRAQLLKFAEPERSSHWLRCLFEEDPDEAVLQIDLWSAYQACFLPRSGETGNPLLPAADFIKNVSTTFAEKAAAQVQDQKFVIKGIRIRRTPVDLKGEEYSKCSWRQNGVDECGQFFMSPEEMYKHILKSHLSATELEGGRFENTDLKAHCLWGRCHRFKSEPATKLAQIAAHIKVHLPPRPSSSPKESSDISGPPPAKRMKPSYIISPPRQIFKYQNTAIDERQDAAGIPLSAVLVLRNLARNLPKTEAEENSLKADGTVTWTDRLFKPVEQRLFEVMVHNNSLVSPYPSIISTFTDQ